MQIALASTALPVFPGCANPKVTWCWPPSIKASLLSSWRFISGPKANLAIELELAWPHPYSCFTPPPSPATLQIPRICPKPTYGSVSAGQEASPWPNGLIFFKIPQLFWRPFVQSKYSFVLVLANFLSRNFHCFYPQSAIFSNFCGPYIAFLELNVYSWAHHLGNCVLIISFFWVPLWLI